MKKHNEFTVVLERDLEGWYVASVPQLKGCHTQGKSIDQVIHRIKEAILLCLESEKDSALSQVELIGVQRIKV